MKVKELIEKGNVANCGYWEFQVFGDNSFSILLIGDKSYFSRLMTSDLEKQTFRISEKTLDSEPNLSNFLADIVNPDDENSRIRTTDDYDLLMNLFNLEYYSRLIEDYDENQY